MIADYQTAAVKAAETLVNFNVCAAPVLPLPILKKLQNVVVVPFAEMAQRMGKERETLLDVFGVESRAAVTTIKEINGKPCYFVAYNQQLPFALLQRALARELGHIVLGHDGSRPVEVRMAESYCFAHHLITPRALIKALQESRYTVTVEMLGNVTGCYEECLERMRKLPGTNVPAELNWKIRALFSNYLQNFFKYQENIAENDHSKLADFGTYMDNYQE